MEHFFDRRDINFDSKPRMNLSLTRHFVASPFVRILKEENLLVNVPALFFLPEPPQRSENESVRSIRKTVATFCWIVSTDSPSLE